MKMQNYFKESVLSSEPNELLYLDSITYTIDKSNKNKLLTIH